MALRHNSHRHQVVRSYHEVTRRLPGSDCSYRSSNDISEENGIYQENSQAKSNEELYKCGWEKSVNDWSVKRRHKTKRKQNELGHQQNAENIHEQKNA